MNKIYGYIRVSTREQNNDRQHIALENFGVPAEKIFIDKQSVNDFSRPQYRKLLKKIKTGDMLVRKSIDKLSRSYEELLDPAFAQIERDFIKQRQAEGIATAKSRGLKFERPNKKSIKNN